MAGSDEQYMEATYIAQDIGITTTQKALEGASSTIAIESAAPVISIEGTSSGTGKTFQCTSSGTGIAFQGTGTDTGIAVHQGASTGHGIAFQGRSTRIAMKGTSIEITDEGNNTGEGMRKRKSMGRQKIKMEKVENASNLQVTFSRRRKGIFKKAHELAIMTGAEVAFIVFSPAGKVYSYGSPNVKRVIERFTTGVHQPHAVFERIILDVKKQKALETTAELEDVMKKLEIGKKHGEWLDQQLDQNEFKFWDTDNQNTADLERSIEMLQEIKKVVAKEIDNQWTTRNPMHYGKEGIPPPMHVANPTTYAYGEGSRSDAGGNSGDFSQFTAGASGL